MPQEDIAKPDKGKGRAVDDHATKGTTRVKEDIWHLHTLAHAPKDEPVGDKKGQSKQTPKRAQLKIETPSKMSIPRKIQLHDNINFLLVKLTNLLKQLQRRPSRHPGQHPSQRYRLPTRLQVQNRPVDGHGKDHRRLRLPSTSQQSTQCK